MKLKVSDPFTKDRKTGYSVTAIAIKKYRPLLWPKGKWQPIIDKYIFSEEVKFRAGILSAVDPKPFTFRNNCPK